MKNLKEHLNALITKLSKEEEAELREKLDSLEGKE